MANDFGSIDPPDIRPRNRRRMCPWCEQLVRDGELALNVCQPCDDIRNP